MQKDLVFFDLQHFHIISSNILFSQSQSQHRLSQFFSSFWDLSITEISLEKWKSIDDEAMNHKRLRFNSQKSNLNQKYKVQQALKKTQTTEWKSVNYEAKLFKKFTFNSQRSKSYQKSEVSSALKNTHTWKQKSENNKEMSFKWSQFNSQRSNLHQKYEVS